MTNEEQAALFDLYNSAKQIICLIDQGDIDAGSPQQDHVYAQFEFDDLRAALNKVESLKGCGSTTDIEGELPSADDCPEHTKRVDEIINRSNAESSK